MIRILLGLAYSVATAIYSVGIMFSIVCFRRAKKARNHWKQSQLIAMGFSGIMISLLALYQIWQAVLKL